MPRLEYSSRAEEDYVDISIFGQERFGVHQADRYIEQIERACQRLAKFPDLGRPCKPLNSGLFRFEEGSHVIFYRRLADGIVVGRILHKSSDPARHVV